MVFPAPVPGLVVRYAFLWSDEAQAGMDAGRKDRPCAVLLTVQSRSGRQVVTVLPITHRPPMDSRLAVEIPLKTKRRLGLDDARSWIVVSEANRFFWPGPDVRTVSNEKPGDIAYGLLPAALYDEVRTKWLAAFDRGNAGQTVRSE